MSPNPYVQAILALDAMDQEVQDGFEVSFMESNVSRMRQYGEATYFSAKQQAVIRHMVERYLGAHSAAEWFHGQQALGL